MGAGVMGGGCNGSGRYGNKPVKSLLDWEAKYICLCPMRSLY